MTITFTWESAVVLLALLGLFLGGAKLYGDTRAWMAEIQKDVNLIKAHLGLEAPPAPHTGD